MSTREHRTLSIDGMHCEHCVRAVRSSLEELEGLSVDDLQIGRAQVSYEADHVTEEDISRAIEDAGYELLS